MSIKPEFMGLNPRDWGDEPIVLPEERDHRHPEKYYKDLIWVENNMTEEIWAVLRTPAFTEPFIDPITTPVELCRNCGWHSLWESNTGYASRVRVIHARVGMAIWSIGSKWLLRDQPNDCFRGNDYITQTFLRQQPNVTIPLVEEMRLLGSLDDRNHYILMSRAQGVPLKNVWCGLSDGQKRRIKEQLTDALRQLRQFTAPTAQAVDGSLMNDSLIGRCAKVTPSCVKMGSTADEWFENLGPTVRAGLAIIHDTKDPRVIEEKFQELKNDFPKCEPYVLTHGDLDFSNIIVNEDGVVAIIDWEVSGYLPWWVERIKSYITGTDPEFIREVWQDLCPEMDHDTYVREVVRKVEPVINAWTRGRDDHPDRDIFWARRAWCECRPIAGCFSLEAMGQQSKHAVRVIDESPNMGDPSGKVAVENVEGNGNAAVK